MAYERVDPADRRRTPSPLLKELSISIPVGTRVLISGFESSRRSGVVQGDGRRRDRGRGAHPAPAAAKTFAFSPSGLTCRPALCGRSSKTANTRSAISDDRIFTLLRELNLEQVVTQAGGLDSERDWRTLLSAARAATLGLDPDCSRGAAVRLSGPDRGDLGARRTRQDPTAACRTFDCLRQQRDGGRISTSL